MSEVGVKFDQEKNRLDLLPIESLEAVGRVLTLGAKKYSPDNWRIVPGAKWRYVGAALRHIFAHMRGEFRDKETSELHLSHAACCLLFLIWFHETGTEPK